MEVCNNPGILKAMMIINSCIDIIKILVPVILILTSIISLAKAFLNNDQDEYKKCAVTFIEKFIIGAFIFFVPTIVSSFIKLVDTNLGYEDCFTNANEDYITELYEQIAVEKVTAAESSYNESDYHKAVTAVNDVEDKTIKENLTKRLDTVKEKIDNDTAEKIAEQEAKRKKRAADNIASIKAQEGSASASEGESLSVSNTGSSGSGTCQMHVAQSSEPDPSAAINCYPSIVAASNFVYPKDSKTGLPLGAWPKNYASIPTQLTSMKTYNSEFIWPITPTNSTYSFVYEHNGMDIMANFGTPVYSPVDGTLLYSEWGHTCNNGGDETAYSLSIQLSNPVTVSGKTITTIFFTHMSGIRYRCSWGACNRTVQKGELIGFSGNAAGSATTGGWAPHLHLTYYTASGYNDGLGTSEMEALYNVPSGKTGQKYTMVAGG